MTVINWIFMTTVFFYALSGWKAFRYYKVLDDSIEKQAVRWQKRGLFFQFLVLAGTWVETGYAPLTTVAGILMTLSFFLSAALIVGRFKTVVPILTSLFLPLIFLLALLALFSGLGAAPLMEPRLMTPGMACHISLTFLGFSHFTLGFGVAVAFWIQEGQLKQHQIKSWSYRLPALESLDGLTAFHIGLGFLFWLVGLGLGAVQAFQVWNRLPIDDPKILGSFLVLVIYGLFFLLRWGFKMRDRKTMTLVMAGYFLALFTFVGVRVFLSTLHGF